MTLKAVIFDCFGVLILPGRTLLYQSYPQFSTQIRDLEYQSDYGMISRHQFDQSIAELIGMGPNQVKKHYFDSNMRNEQVVDWIRELRASGKYKIGFLSNIGHGWIDDFITAKDRAELFDETVLSSHVGMLKPDPAIFELMAAKLGVNADECIMIDDIAANIEGSRVAGMQGIIFTSADQARTEFQQLLESIYA